MKPFIVGTAVALLCLIHRAFAEPGTEPGAASRHVTNGIQQQLFVARLVEIHTTRHRRYRWAMTFERVSDGERFQYEVYDDSPVATALGFRKCEHGREGVKDRIAAAPPVLLMAEPYWGRNFPEGPENVVLGCFVIDKAASNTALHLNGRSDDEPLRQPVPKAVIQMIAELPNRLPDNCRLPEGVKPGESLGENEHKAVGEYRKNIRALQNRYSELKKHLVAGRSIFEYSGLLSKGSIRYDEDGGNRYRLQLGS